MTAPANNALFIPASTITLSANATDANTSATISKVDFYKGTTLLGTVTAAPYTFSWANVAAGTYSITAKATDSQSLVQTSTAITVIVDKPPTVTLTAPANNASFVGLANITLTATATDTGGSVSKVEFYNGTTLIGTATASPFTATWSNVAPGTYQLTAKATDNQGAVTTTAANTITVTNPITTSITAPATNTTYGPNPTIAITASATDSKGTISKIDFFNGSTNIGTATTAPYTISWSNAPAGTASITAVATDSQGLTKTSSPITLNIHAAPTISIQTPVNNSNAVAPANINLTANATATGTTVTQVSYYNGTNFIGSATQSPYSVSWNNVAAGSYQLTAKVTDGFNDTATSTPITITVAPNMPPTVSLTATPTNAMAPASITLTANAADSDGTIAKVDFYNGTTLLTTITSAPYTTTWGNVSVGTYNLSAVATDNNGASTTSSVVTVTINPAVAQVYYIQTDQIDTPRQIVDSNGNVVWQWENSDPYGVTPPNQNPTNQGTFTYNPRFAGQYFDKETNLFYNYYRDYDPATGRFLQSDPLGLFAGLNTIAYVGGNPVSYSDRRGLDRWGDDPSLKQIPSAWQRFLDDTQADQNRLFGSLNKDAASSGCISTGGGPQICFGPAAIEAIGSKVAAACLSNGMLRTSKTVADQLSGPRSYIPVQSIVNAIENGVRSADPQGVANQFMYKVSATFNDSVGTLEVLVNEASSTINHVLFRTAK